MSKRIHPIITSADVRQDHAPGPWSERDCEIQAVDGSPICEMLARPEDKEKWGYHHADANSRLICAAPDLLDALEGLLDPTHQCEACDNSRELNGGCTRWSQVRAAVAQAKGLESEEAWEEWTTSFYAKAQAGGAK